MATTTTLKCIGGSYGNTGNAAYTNSASSSVFMGASGSYFRTRLIFPSLRASLGLGNSTIKITSVYLYLRRTGEGPTTVAAGCNTSGAWGATQLGRGTGTISDTTKWYSINISGVGSYIDDYTGNWYLHLTGPSSTRVRCNGFGTDFAPYIKVTWEYVANTIKSELDESIIGQATNFNITPGASDASYTLTYKFGNQSGTIAEKTTDTTITWTPPLDLITEIPNAIEGTVTVTMTVYNTAGSVIRTELLYLAIVVPEDIAPTIHEDGLSVTFTKDLGGYGLTGQSQLNIVPAVDLNSTWGSSLKTINITINDGENIQNLTWTSFTEQDAGIFSGAVQKSNILTSAGDVSIEMTAIDSRGRSSTMIKTMPVREYSLPVITNVFTVTRYEKEYDSNEEVVGYFASDIGENVWVTFEASVSQVLSDDGIDLNYLNWRIEEVNNNTNDVVTYSANLDTQSTSHIEDREIVGEDIIINVAHSYSYVLTVFDTVGNEVVQYESVAPGIANLSLAASMRGVTFGGISKSTEEDPWFENNYSFMQKGIANFYSPIYLSDDLTLKNGKKFGWHPGDSITFPHVVTFPGYLTSSSASLRFTVNVGMPIYANGFTFSGSILARGVNGYFNGSSTAISVGQSGYSWSTYGVVKECGVITVMLNKSSAFSNVTNNTPVAVHATGFTIKFT